MLTVFILNSKCNMQCEFCICNDEKELDTNYIKNKLDKCNGTIIFSGGEPLIRDDINELCEYAKNKNLKVGIHTNAILIDKLDLENIDFINLPLDGTKETHNKLRPNHFNIIINTLNILKERKKEIKVTTIVTKINKDDIKNIPSMLYKYNIFMWKIFKYKGNNSKFIISDKEFDIIKKIETSINTKFIGDIDEFGDWKKVDSFSIMRKKK